MTPRTPTPPQDTDPTRGGGAPAVGMVTGAAAGILRSSSTWPARLPRPLQRLAAASWQWLLVIVIADTLLLFLGSIPLVLAGLNAPTLFVYSLFAAAAGIPLVALAAAATAPRPAVAPAAERPAAIWDPPPYGARPRVADELHHESPGAEDRR